MTESRKPDYSVGAMNKITGEKQFSVGGAWKNDDGPISIKLDPFVVLTGNKDIVITMFPREYDANGHVKKEKPPRRNPGRDHAAHEIPF